MKIFAGTLLLALAVHAAAAHADSGLFSMDGKTYSVKELSPAQQQQMYELQFEQFEKSKQLIDNAVIDTYLDQQAAKQGKPRSEVETKTFEVKDPSEKDMKKWFEENKTRIPPNYQFDQIKGEIEKIVKQERVRVKRDELLEKVKKEHKFALALTKPEAPMVDLKVDGFPTKGKDGAKVTVVEFADYQCPHCKAAVEGLKKVSEKFKDKVKFTYVDFPINPSGISKVVAEGSHCANEQGKFWDYHYKAFDGQSALSNESPQSLAKELKLDEAKFKACMDAGKGKTVVERGRKEGERIGVSGTPYLLINGRRYLGAHTPEALTKEIETELK